jgi:hypothetical protein
MPTFAFTELVHDPLARIESAALGASTSTPLTDKDKGKCVKMGTAQNYIVCTGGNEIEGFLNSVEPWTVNGGYGFGSVLRSGRVSAVVGANQGATAMAVGDLVVADTQAAVGTAGAAAVKTGTPATYKWRCIRIVSGTGVAGDAVLLERI